MFGLNFLPSLVPLFFCSNNFKTFAKTGLERPTPNLLTPTKAALSCFEEASFTKGYLIL